MDRKKHQEKMWRIRNRERTLWLAARNRARRQGIPFDIDVEDIIIPTLCPIFHEPLIVGHPKWAPSLDRIETELGYVKGNIHVISWYANRLKSDASPEDVMAVARYIMLLRNDRL